MTLEELEGLVGAGEIDTVLLAITDMQGRLQGKRLTARHFLEEVASHGRPWSLPLTLPPLGIVMLKAPPQASSTDAS